MKTRRAPRQSNGTKPMSSAVNGKRRPNVGKESTSRESPDQEGFDAYGIEYQKACACADHAVRGKMGQKKNCSDNPLCVYGLGEHKTGIWGPLENLSGVRSSKWLADEAKCKLRPPGTPSGLENLGATCYVNALLQTLFHNKPFRQLVYSWRGEASGTGLHAIALQKLFGSLELSTATVVDPTSFAKLLNLQTGIQQDAQEFNKLLLDHLSQVMTSKITEMFRGELEYETKCRECGKASRRKASFYELELPIKGETAVRDCLAAMQKVEALTGDNMYMCETCGKKCEAERRIVLAELPEVLNLQLLRFIFDPVALAKRKLKDAIDIPMELELSDNTGQTAMYDLQAVLFHRGTSAHSGHYVAEVLCGENESGAGTWWTFNDDVVEEKVMTTASNSSNKKVKVAVSQAPSKDAYMLVFRKRLSVDSKPIESTQDAVSALSYIPEGIVAEVQKENEERRMNADVFSQQRALWESLVQKRKEQYSTAFNPIQGQTKNEERYWIPTDWLQSWITGEKVSPVLLPATQGSPIVLDDNPSTSSSSTSPSEAKADVKLATEVVDVEAMEVDEANKKQEPVPTVSQLFQDQIEMASYLCPHGKLAPTLAKTKMKLISKRAWGSIRSSGDDSKLIPCDHELTEKRARCSECSFSRSGEFQEAKAEKLECDKFEAILAKPHIPASPSVEGSDLTWVSKKWTKELRDRNKARLTQLREILESTNSTRKSATAGKKHKKIDDFFDAAAGGANAGENDANADIKCEHSNLVSGKLLKRLMRTEDFQTLVESADGGKWSTTTTMFRYPQSSECTLCEHESNEAKVEAKREKEERDVLLRNPEHGFPLKEVLKRRHGHPGSSASDFQVLEELIVLPKPFLDSLRLFFEGETGEIAKPDCSSLVCEHGKTTVNPAAMALLLSLGNPPIAPLLDESVPSTDTTFGPVVEFVSPKEYAAVIHAMETFTDDEQGEDAGSSLRPPKLRIVADSYQGDPELCAECIGNATHRWEKARTVFTDRPIYATRLAIGQVVPGGPGAVATSSRSSGRAAVARSSRQGNKRSPVLVSSSDTVFLVKMKIYQSSMGLKCEPSQIRLYHHGKMLESPEYTLEMAGIRAGDDLYYDTNGNEDDDLVGLVRETERGFTGTALVSSSGAKPVVVELEGGKEEPQVFTIEDTHHVVELTD